MATAPRLLYFCSAMGIVLPLRFLVPGSPLPRRFCVMLHVGSCMPYCKVWRSATCAKPLRKHERTLNMPCCLHIAEALRVSSVPLPALQIPPGTAVLSRLSPALAGHAEVDFYGVQIRPISYPDHDSFVGRLEDLRCLWQLPSPYADRALQRIVWVHGDAGMGKSALLRQFAIVVRDLTFHVGYGASLLTAPLWVVLHQTGGTGARYL